MKNIFDLYKQQINTSKVNDELILANYNQFKEFFGLSQQDHLFTENGRIQEQYILGIFYALVASNNLVCIDKDNFYFNITDKNNTKHQVKILNVSLANVNQIMKLDVNIPQSFDFLFETPNGIKLWDCHFNSNMANLFKIINFFLLGDLIN